jgi:hypothetical protein
MHPVQATETIQWAEQQHQDLVAHAERNQLGRTLHQWPATPNSVPITMTALAVVLVMMVLLSIGAI